MDALIYGYSNFTFTEPTTTTKVASTLSPYAESIATSDDEYRPETVLITPTMETVKPVYVKPDVIPTVTPSYEEEKPFIPIIDIVNPTPTYVKPDVMPTFIPQEAPMVIPIYEDEIKPPRPPAPTPDPIPIIDIINSSPISIAEDDGRKPIAPSPIVNIINPSPYIAPPLIVGGGSMGGGGGATDEGRKPLSGAVATKPSFIKKNFIPILLIASAIYVFIKKPIK